MKQRLLLSFMFFVGILNAQIVCDYPEGVITSLVITEAQMISTNNAYLEITNMGENSVRLSEFKFGRLRAHSTSGPVMDLCNDGWYAVNEEFMRVPSGQKK